MGQRPAQQIDALVLLPLQRVAQHMRDTADAQGAHGIDKERLAAIERVDVAEAVRKAGPTRGLHRAAYLQRKLIKMQLPFVRGNAALEHQTAKVAVSGDVVEAVIVHAGVGQMLRHVRDHVPPRHGQQIPVARQIEAQQGIAILKSLRPLGPAARRITAGDGDDGGAIAGFQRRSRVSVFFEASSSARATAGNRSLAFRV